MKGEEIGRWAWSEDGTKYGATFGSRSDAIEGAREDGVEGSVFVAQVSFVPRASEAVLSILNSNALGEHADEYLADNYAMQDGCCIEGDGALWSDLAAALEPVVLAWEKRNGVYVNWYQVGKSELVEMKAAPAEETETT